MPEGLLMSITVLVLAMFVGFEVITKVPPTLHTPLMSGANAISGIAIIGALLVTGRGNTYIDVILGVGQVYTKPWNITVVLVGLTLLGIATLQPQLVGLGALGAVSMTALKLKIAGTLIILSPAFAYLFEAVNDLHLWAEKKLGKCVFKRQ